MRGYELGKWIDSWSTSELPQNYESINFQACTRFERRRRWARRSRSSGWTRSSRRRPRTGGTSGRRRQEPEMFWSWIRKVIKIFSDIITLEEIMSFCILDIAYCMLWQRNSIVLQLAKEEKNIHALKGFSFAVSSPVFQAEIARWTQL